MIFSPFERMVAMRYLRARRQEGFISVIAWFSLIGIFLGVAALIITLAIFNGFREQLIERILGLNGHIEVIGAGRPLTNFDALAARLRTIPEVVSVIPEVEGQAMVTAHSAVAGALVRGIRPQDLKSLSQVSGRLVAGSLDRFEDDAVVIGYRLAARLGVNIGGEITLITPEGAVTAFGTIPRMKSYHVVGIFNVGMSEYDSTFIYMPLDDAQLYFRLPNAVSELSLRLDDPERAQIMTGVIRQATASDGVQVIPWQQVNASYFNFVALQRNLYTIVVTLIIVVAAFNIISGLIMLVKDKGRGIAILRTMGATRGMIMRIFFLGGMSIGLVGTALGLAFALWFCLNIEAIHQFLERVTGQNLFPAEFFYLTQLPAKLDPGEVIEVVAMSLGLSFLASIYPSWRAARLDPVEALRYE
ncbi:MAG TPA: lipoprotein-releasing ABC transporter permease subunit [Alphaproteobacteria bacterium]|nr:lipoprotein-releasing ABC transporter permease subunit [Alphaproteobacteria bacterium]